MAVWAACPGAGPGEPLEPGGGSLLERGVALAGPSGDAGRRPVGGLDGRHRLADDLGRQGGGAVGGRGGGGGKGGAGPPRAPSAAPPAWPADGSVP